MKLTRDEFALLQINPRLPVGTADGQRVMENWRQRLRQQNLNNGRRTQAILKARREAVKP